jgi:glutamate-ammonia-ligase adenylyltransferase
MAGAPLELNDVAARLGAAYRLLPAEERARHLEALRSIAGPADAWFEATPVAPGRWRLLICAADHVGLLSSIAGLLTATSLDVAAGDVFTLDAAPGGAAPSPALRRRPGIRPLRASPRPAPAGPPRHLALDVFEVTSDVEPDWDAFRRELQELVGLLAADRRDDARALLLLRLTTRDAQADRPISEATDAPAPTVDVEIDAESDLRSDPDAIRLTIRSPDQRGFLFEFTSALITLDVSVRRAEIRTAGGLTADTFWLTTSGGSKLGPDRLHELRTVAVLIRRFAHLLGGAPDPAQALQQFSAMARSMLARNKDASAWGALDSEGVLRTLAELLGVSRFLWEDFLRLQHDSLFPLLTDTEALDEPPTRHVLRARLQAEIDASSDHAEALRRVNAFKDREMFRIDLRHITRRTGFLAFSRELAELAEAVLDAVAAEAERVLVARHGLPRLDDGGRCGWSICALGKFGGRELGFASDIELLIVHAGAGATDGLEPISNAQYFEAFARELRDSIVARREGIFEIDTRLRPYGQAGPFATALPAFRAYYSADGEAQQFERMALVRLRPVAGDEALGQAVIEARDAFVYSGAPLDLQDIAHLRSRQASELATGDLDAKYGAGGVVDIEYFVQALQIEVGAIDPTVRAAGTLEGCELLRRGGWIPELLAAKLQDAYLFLRQLIDGLRVVRGNAKDLAVPDRESREFAYLARRLYFERPEDLARAIDVRMAFARGLWDLLEELRPPR